MAAQAGVAGSTKVGEWCMIGGQAGLAGHIKVGDKVGIAGQAGVSSSVKAENQIMGSPAFDAKQYFKASVAYKKLPEIYSEVSALRRELNELKKLINK